MNLKNKLKINRKVLEIINAFLYSINNEMTRNKMVFQLKEFLEKEEIKYETINSYTSPSRIDQGLVDIRVDDDLYPLNEKIKVDETNWFEYCVEWEDAGLELENTIELFQFLINEGFIWTLGLTYIRLAEDLITMGYCTLSHKETVGYYVWGSPKIPSKYDLKPDSVGTDSFVQKRKDLDNNLK